MKQSRIAFMIAITMAISIQSSAQITADWKEHKVEDIGFTIKFPPSWSLNDSTDEAVFILRSPLESDTDQFAENFNLQFRDLSVHAFDLKRYVKMNVEDVETFENYKKLSDRYFFWFGKEIYEIVFSGNVSGIPYALKWKQWYIVYKNKGYVITYCTQNDKKDKLESVQNGIFKSIRIK